MPELKIEASEPGLTEAQPVRDLSAELPPRARIKELARSPQRLLLAFLVLAAIYLPFPEFFDRVANEWLTDPTFRFGVLIPIVSIFLIWRLRYRLMKLEVQPWNGAIAIILLGCALAVMGSLGGVLLVSGAGFVALLIGAAGYLLGKKAAAVLSPPLLFLMLMVPWPSYTLGQIDWRLQTLASSASAAILEAFGVVTFQNGNMLQLPHFSLAVKEACSGSRSLFALIALAAIVGLYRERRWAVRILLVAVAPVIALAANVIRIVGTGVAANFWGSIAAEETLHTVWGLVVFLLAAGCLLETLKLLRWLTSKFAQPS